MNNRNHSFKMRASYWFDNKMAQGFWPKVRLLLIMTLVFVIIVGFLAALSRGGIHDNFVEDFIRSFMYSIGKGGALSTEDAHISVVYFILMLLCIIYCMFFSAILIGLISNALRTKVDDLGKGHSYVLEEGHTLILGFNDATFVLLGELIEANSNLKKPQVVVVLGEVDQRDMIEQINKKLGSPKSRPKTHIICRTGSIYNFGDLRRCSIETSRSVIINAANDFEAVKATMACSHILNESDYDQQPFIISVIQNEENIIESKLAAKGKSRDNLIVLALNEVLARIMVHTSRQPGLSDVFTELFNFCDDELYVFTDDPSFPTLYGKTIAEINHYLQESFAVGIKNESGVIIDAPMETVFKKGDSLIIVKRDDEPLKIMPHPGKVVIPTASITKETVSVNVLIIGVQPVLNLVLMEYANYLPTGSSICIIDSNNGFSKNVDEATLERLKIKGVELIVKAQELSRKKHINLLLREYSPDCVLVLIDEDSADQDKQDEIALRTLIYLREFRNRADKHFSITCEMLQAKNKELAVATEQDDFIVSRQISALLMSQISQNKEMASLFETLLSSKGYEIYMKPAARYLPMGEPIDLISTSQIVAEKGEIFIGIRQKRDGRYQIADINPVKYESDGRTPKEYVFEGDDYIVVLSNDSQ